MNLYSHLKYNKNKNRSQQNNVDFFILKQSILFCFFYVKYFVQICCKNKKEKEKKNVCEINFVFNHKKLFVTIINITKDEKSHHLTLSTGLVFLSDFMYLETYIHLGTYTTFPELNFTNFISGRIS